MKSITLAAEKIGNTIKFLREFQLINFLSKLKEKERLDIKIVVHSESKSARQNRYFWGGVITYSIPFIEDTPVFVEMHKEVLRILPKSKKKDTLYYYYRNKYLTKITEKGMTVQQGLSEIKSNKPITQFVEKVRTDLLHPDNIWRVSVATQDAESWLSERGLYNNI